MGSLFKPKMPPLPPVAPPVEPPSSELSQKEKDEIDDNAEIVTKPIKIAEYSSVDELSKIFETKPNDIIQKCMSLGVLATINQRLDWDVIELLSEEFGYIP